MKQYWLTGIACVIISGICHAQQDSLPASNQLDSVMVTATRTARTVKDIPMPVLVIDKNTIERMGSSRLNEVLAEQTGLQIISDHGTGIQLQGMSNDYILILVDGEPLIGRDAGTLDLSRVTIGNIERIEIVKGPSSSLYGSEAMGGVINIITKKIPDTLSGSLQVRARKYGTTDINGTIGQQYSKWGWSAFTNHYQTDGFYNTDSVSKAMPAYKTWTFGSKLNYRISSKLDLLLNARLYKEDQDNQYLTTQDNKSMIVATGTSTTDVNLSPSLLIHINDRQQLQVKNYYTSYKTNTTDHNTADGQLYDQSFFNQSFNRTEAQYDIRITPAHLTTTGVGNIIETARATRYEDKNTFHQQYVFGQHQWQVSKAFNLAGGFRFDKHSEYGNRFSPKLAMRYNITQWLSVQASAGGGYKAPTFSQLLLNFTNPLVGYTVLGNRIAASHMQQLQQSGQIASLYIDPSTIGDIKAESAVGYNAGVTLTPASRLSLTINVFRNNIKDLIDTRAIAIKTNGQNVFSYFNYSRVYTQGIDAQVSYEPVRNLTFSAGYQYLDAKDADVVDQIKSGKVYYRDASGDEYKVKLRNYGGLYNRSKHSGNVKLQYNNPQHGYSILVRGIYRGRFGYGADLNSNAILDAKDEYAKGYTVCNISAQKSLGSITLEAGVNNVFRASNAYDPTLAPAVWYGGIQWKFNHKTKQ